MLAGVNRRLRKRRMAVAPAGGFAHDSPIGLLHSGGVNRCDATWRQRPAVKHVLLHKVCKSQTVFRVGHQQKMHFFRGTAYPAGLDGVVVQALEDVLGIPTVKPPFAVEIHAVVGRIPIVVRPVVVARVVVDQHVGDQIVDVDLLRRHLIVGQHRHILPGQV
jgi:hypothetical protein